MKKQFFYPQNMKAKPKLWLWSVRDLVIVCIAAIPSVMAVEKLGIFTPAAMTAVYAFLTVRMDDQSVLDFLGRAFRFFLTSQQSYLWKESKKHGKENE